MRHLDVNILWMQEQCARKILPLAKVPGEDNPADVMTKNLTSNVIDKNMKRLKLRLEEGRAEKAAQLHALSWKASTSISDEWQRARDKANDQRGGDRWDPEAMEVRGTGSTRPRAERYSHLTESPKGRLKGRY